MLSLFFSCSYLVLNLCHVSLLLSFFVLYSLLFFVISILTTIADIAIAIVIITKRIMCSLLSGIAVSSQASSWPQATALSAWPRGFGCPGRWPQLTTFECMC